MFRGAQIKGCFFHLSQILYRRIQQHESLAAKCLKDKDHPQYRVGWECFRKLQMLSALPLDKLEEAINIIEKEAPIEFLSLVKWFKEGYIVGRPFDDNGVIKYRSPRFPPEFWNHHDTVIALGIRTSNNAETFHNQIGGMFRQRPSFWSVIRRLIQFSEQSEKLVERVKVGIFPVRTAGHRRTIDKIFNTRTILSFDQPLDKTLDALTKVAFQSWNASECHKCFEDTDALEEIEEEDDEELYELAEVYEMNSENNLPAEGEETEEDSSE